MSKRNGSNKVTFEEFLARSMKIHGQKFEYRMSDYINVIQKIQITCNECGSVFYQNPFSHMKGYGCKQCAVIAEGKRKFEKAKSEFIHKCNSKYGDKYDLSLVEYKGRSKKITVTCKKHKNTFDISAGSFLRSAVGCDICAVENGTKYSKNRSKEAAQNFVTKANEVHGFKYDYSETEYKLSSRKVKIICKEHGYFYQNPSDHLKGTGCTSCAKYGFDKNKPAILYYIKIEIDGSIFYKIGITNIGIDARFKKHKEKITILFAKQFEIGQSALEEERRILKLFKEYRYIGLPVIIDGNTELFIQDVLGVDK